MPLNSHSYLVAQGWQGTGQALREGAISRPVIITQKKNLAGVGQDRDEAFPFWDHVFTAVATSINVKPSNDDSDDGIDTPRPSGSSTPLDRTSTGILSNRPQKAGLPALEGPAVPRSSRQKIVALAKRESARRCLYSRFFRGPVLGPDTEARELLALEAVKSFSPPRAEPNGPERNILITREKAKKRKFREEHWKVGVTRTKRKSKREAEAEGEGRERRRLKRSRKEAEKRFYETRVEGDVEIGFTKMSAKDLEQNDDDASYPREKDRKKKKRKVKESAVRYEA